MIISRLKTRQWKILYFPVHTSMSICNAKTRKTSKSAFKKNLDTLKISESI